MTKFACEPRCFAFTSLINFLFLEPVESLCDACRLTPRRRASAALAKQQQTSVAKLDPELLVRTLVQRRHLISFFNDIKVTDHDPAIPAAQYFATFERENNRPLEVSWDHGRRQTEFWSQHNFPNWAWGVFVGSIGHHREWVEACNHDGKTSPASCIRSLRQDARKSGNSRKNQPPVFEG